MYAFFKKFKQFFIGLGAGLMSVIAVILVQRNRNADVATDFAELDRATRELREKLARASDIRTELEATNARLRDKLNNSTSELLFETEQLRLENNRQRHELESRIGFANETINKLEVSTTRGAGDIARLREACGQLEDYIQKNGIQANSLGSVNHIINDSDDTDSTI